MTLQSPYDDLPQRVQNAFCDRTMLSATELAGVLEMDPKTLRKLIGNGDIAGRLKGTGMKRPRWGFTIADVAKYLRRTQRIETPRDEGRNDPRRKREEPSEEALHYLRALIAQHPQKFGTMNVYLRRRKRKSNARLNLGTQGRGEQDP